MVLEKVLKGLIVRSTQKQAPYIHDLVRLQEIAGLKLPEQEIDLLDEINDFNIRARYPEYKLRFYKLCTRAYTKSYIDKIIPLYQKLCQDLKRKK
jgi:HEPN domain-containing protein